jgi:probable HAF family extracellular repeat protein
MKSRICTWIAGTSVLAALAMPALLVAQQEQSHQAQQLPHYTVVDLGTLGGTFSIAFGINDKGQIDGLSTTPGDQVTHGFFLENGVMTDMGTLGGPNSQALFGPGEAFQATGLAENGIPDPNGEDFCGLGTNLVCLGFLWQNGVMTPLSTLGGNNAQGGDINAQGQIAGMAENSTPDPNCPAPQVLQFRPAVWTAGKIQALPVYPGDADGAAFWINDRGAVVGASGTCAAYDLRYGVPLQPRHALLWRTDSVKAIDLGTLGGMINNSGFAINDMQQVVGASDLSGDKFQHAFLWQGGVMTDLGALPGDVASAAIGINNSAQATGVSIDAAGNLRAFLWQDGVMTDLNSLIPPNSPLYLMHGCGINSRGQIVGYALQISTGELHAYLATPMPAEGNLASTSPNAEGEIAASPKFALPENARKQLQKWLHIRRFAPAAADPQGPPSR